MSKQSTWLTAWQSAAQDEKENQLILLLKDLPPLDDEQNDAVIETSIDLALLKNNLSLLAEIFNQLSELSKLRATALEAALELADERNPNFRDLLLALRNGEQVLVLDLIPEDVRSLYWSEANGLAALGGDDAQLILLKLANRLSRKARRSTFEELSEAVSRLKEPFKHAQAHALLIELGVPMSFFDIESALERARSIPDPMLRAMTESRLVELSSSNS